MRKYEVEFVAERKWYCQALIMMLTGYSLVEVLAKTGKVSRMPSTDFKKAFRALGYSCSERFKPFDAATEYPVLMRALGPPKPEREPGADGKRRVDSPDWYAFVYYDQKVYDPFHGITPLSQFSECYPEMRISSMIQVWVSAGTESIATNPIR
ncbi:hypothetical protein [Hymenobacter jeollabukensis]|uniref:Uncharacterized protein n=1 Tax=Hymenobacter jeollabukensis TaxID=2025313 RepID=A0A5R8WJ18_9BACT|nr:hypothetical protein [Hymenobacter jeollabukensis]TLM88697.1 hypothetical protein FDY95_22955 [Hymenobacter jeollabukensis]